MTHQEILEKAIEKAIENGWKPKHEYRITLKTSTGESTIEAKANYDIIYNHDFAKALWGEKEIVIDSEWADPEDEEHYSLNDHNTPISETVIPAWQYHLQQMVIADDPIEYLGDNI